METPRDVDRDQTVWHVLPGDSPSHAHLLVLVVSATVVGRRVGRRGFVAPYVRGLIWMRCTHGVGRMGTHEVRHPTAGCGCGRGLGCNAALGNAVSVTQTLSLLVARRVKVCVWGKLAEKILKWRHSCYNSLKKVHSTFHCSTEARCGGTADADKARAAPHA